MELSQAECRMARVTKAALCGRPKGRKSWWHCDPSGSSVDWAVNGKDEIAHTFYNADESWKHEVAEDHKVSKSISMESPK